MSESGQFTCARCGETFDRAWTDAEANAEADRLFGVREASTAKDVERVCEDCFNVVMEGFRADPLARVCQSCGLHYTLAMHTVCPRCFEWPRQETKNLPPPVK